MVREEKIMRKDQHEAGMNPVDSSHISYKRNAKKPSEKGSTELKETTETLADEQRDEILIRLAKMHGMKW